MQLEDEYQLFETKNEAMSKMNYWLQTYPQAWAETSRLGQAKNQPPVHVELKALTSPIAVCPPMSREARNGISPHIARLLQLGVLASAGSQGSK